MSSFGHETIHCLLNSNSSTQPQLLLDFTPAARALFSAPRLPGEFCNDLSYSASAPSGFGRKLLRLDSCVSQLLGRHLNHLAIAPDKKSDARLVYAIR